MAHITPSTTGQLRRLFRLLVYYKRYIQGFEKIDQPLFQLLKKENIKNEQKVIKISTQIVWTNQHQNTLQALILALITSPPLLSYPDFELPFTLRIDASNKGLGAALYQFQDNNMGILRALKGAEQGYSSSKLEFLSLKWTVCELFQDYLLYAKEVHVYTDNNLLLYILSSAKLNPTGQRWVNDLADFNLQIHYTLGRTNKML